MPALKRLGAAALSAFGFGQGGATTVTANYLIVAGGGAGSAGGGGAGGFRTSAGTSGGGASAETALSLSLTTSYTVVVGGGGAGVSAGGAGQGGNGSASSISGTGLTTVTSTGGGGGGTNIANGTAGSSGGSGGGGSYSGGQTNAGGSGTANQGYAGGSNGGFISSPYPAGGGGGAGQVGFNASSNTQAGNGGNGVSSTISGTAVTYAGGGGGGLYTSGGTAGTGGTGGGGAGTGTATGTSGTANTGGGGGGTRDVAGNPSGNGGSGIVIISYTGAQQFGGGVVTSAAGNTIHTFYTSGTLSPLSSLSASYLIVAGGGGGGKARGGGGGAGGMLTGSALTIDTNSTYVVTVGSGGAAAASNNTVASSGSNSSISIFSTVAQGGGGGAGTISTYGTTLNGANGGSGGGVSGNGTANTPSGTGGTGVAGQGNNGGRAYSDNLTYTASGGGGGAGAAGADASALKNGNGGNGSVSSISGTATYYAGGGGGGSDGTSIGLGVGGLGGGGNGGTQDGTTTGSSGTVNTGGGAGGAGGGAAGGYASGGNGGSGIVIIAYPGSTQQMSGGSVTITGGNVIHTFTSSGYLSPITNFNNSLRFRRSAGAYLSRTPTVASNRQKFTISIWFKKGILGTSTYLFGATSDSYNVNFDLLQFNNTDTIRFSGYASTSQYDLNSTQVLRDPAAWYHVVVAVDTTQATASDRIKMYLNGSQITAFGTATYPSQNYSMFIDSTNLHTYGSSVSATTYTLDGYITNTQLIDGQQLGPNSFGAFNSYGTWSPVTYGGSYGNNGFYLPFSPITTTTYAATFNGSNQYLQAGTTVTNFLCTSSTSGITATIEAWVYPTAYNIGGSPWMYSSVYAKGGTWFNFGVRNGNLRFYWYDGGFNYVETPSTSDVPLNQWTHVAVTLNGTSIVLYVNGAIKYSGTPFTGIASSGVGQADLIGQEGGNPTYFAGKISNLRLSNTVVYSTTFIPPAGPLVSTPNTRILTLQNATIVDNGPNAYAITNNGSVTTATATPFTNVNTIGTDQSPQGNNWFGNNFNVVAAGVTYDSMVDVPTLTSANVANYCVMNPLDSGANVTVTNGNLRVNNNFTGTPYSSIRGSIGVSSGKFYWEVTATTVSGNSPSVGIATAQADLTQFVGYDAYSWAYIFSTGNKTTNNSTTAYGNTITSGDIVGIALDMDNGKVWFAKNGTWQASGDPAAGTNYAYNGLTGTMFADAFAYNQSVLDVNFGQQPFVYTPPSGFVALNTYNM